MRTVKTEFPDYDGVLPYIAGYEDTSWHNDACPSIEKDYGNGVRVRIWCDYVDPERRESNGYTRFGVVAYSPTDEEGSDMLSTDHFHLVIERVAQFEASMTIPPLELAKAFCRQLRIELELYKELADETLGIINARNAEFEAKGDHSTCATHDFCDANQVMLDAIESICGFADYHFAQNEMINAAWEIARRARFDADKCCEPVAEPVIEPMTVQEYFRKMLGEEMEDDVAVIPLDSPCGESCKVVIDGVAEMIDTISDRLIKCRTLIDTAHLVLAVQING